jgi:hypothetical protein
LDGAIQVWSRRLRELFDQDSVMFTIEPVHMGEVAR